jgi:hypothetical protein
MPVMHPPGWLFTDVNLHLLLILFDALKMEKGGLNDAAYIVKLTHPAWADRSAVVAE